MSSGKTKGGTILNPVTLAMRARYVLVIKGLPKYCWCDQRLMDYMKSGDQELGVVIKHHEWVEGMEIGDWISDIRVGTGSNTAVI